MKSASGSGISTPDFLSKFDGSGREPRPSQQLALEWVSQHWDKRFLVLQLPTGVGKSAIARAIQLQTGAGIITPSNALLDQYAETYDRLNFVKGRDHYICPKTKLSCGEMSEANMCCEVGCRYKDAKQLAEAGEPTVFNPISLFFSGAQPDVLIIDEAHKLLPTLRLLISRRFSKTKYDWPKTDSMAQLIAWTKEKAKDYEALGVLYKNRQDLRKSAINFSKAKRLRGLAKTIEESPDEFIYYEDGDDLVVEPVDVPRNIVEMVFEGAQRIILMSATIPKRWARDILGHRSFEYLELDSPIPKEQRKIVFDPAGLTAQSEPATIAAWVKKQRSKHAGNAVLHTTYGMGSRLVPYFQGAHLHTSGTKSATFRAFKQNGGLWIAAGVSEGIDLAGDLARLCLVPYLPFQNRESPLVKAVMARDPKAYFLETAITLVQQAGRTTRGPEDWSVTVVGDSRLPWLIKQIKDELPKYFLDAIQWSS